MGTRLQRIEQVCKDFDVKALYVFGSRSADILRFFQDRDFNLKPSPSDVDIGVLTYRTLLIDEKVNLTLQLEELVGVTRVDLVLLEDADAFLAANVIRGKRIYTQNSYLADEYELFILAYAGELIEIERAMKEMG
jgi:predicted nucleotidyltransferase